MIVVDDLHAGYRTRPFHRPVLRNVSFRARVGQVTAIVGPNGAGKTTLFRVLLGFLRPRRGSVRIGGKSAGGYRRRRGVAFLPESLVAPAGWSPRRILEEAADLQGLRSPGREEAIRSGLARTGLDTEHHDRRLSALSRGMCRRTLLAFALLGDPAVVLLDEPMSGLDPEARARSRRIVRGSAAGGAAVILASHELDEVARMADRALVLREGRIVETVEEVDGPSKLLRAASSHRHPP